MTINRRRAPSSKISSEKKISGHNTESVFAEYINGEVVKGTQKQDVVDRYGNKFSVKSGKKWQVFLYGYERILQSNYLNILAPCINAFPENPQDYFRDRIKCIEFKEDYIKKYGRNKAKELKNEEVSKKLGKNLYIESKQELASATEQVLLKLVNKSIIENFLSEALFNTKDVDYLAVQPSDQNIKNIFHVFEKEEVLKKMSARLFPELSKAGNVPEDFNVPKQKLLFKYMITDDKSKNIIEIEIRNDSEIHYRQVRFNMYSKDALSILIDNTKKNSGKPARNNLFLYGKAAEILKIS